jgi:hypothetical protein
MQLSEGSGDTERDAEKTTYLPRPVSQATKELASRVFTDERRLLAVARDGERSSGPSRVQFTAQ